jgi:phosphatidylserine/phosphatidylglycerophosphate/cardiolipin synthase-like enzyme
MRGAEMFRLFHRKADPSHILASSLHDEGSFYKVFIKDLKHCNESVVIESPYLTVRRTYYLAPLFKKLKKQGIKVRINTREPYHHTSQLREEAWDAIAILQKVGVKVYLCKDLRHRKLAIIDNTVLWEGSLNILSQNHSREIMRRSVSKELCKQMTHYTGISRQF